MTPQRTMLNHLLISSPLIWVQGDHGQHRLDAEPDIFPPHMLASLLGLLLQDAKKGVLFEDFPPVLQLQLKRFEYDFARDVMVKVGFQQPANIKYK